MKKMDQLLIEDSTSFKLEKLHLALIKKISEIKEKTITEAQKQYELYNCLNPRYFEQGITPKDAQLKLDAMSPRTNQGLIRPY